jgi:acetyltransferase-like isoleucine patch superfamily enzyme
MQIKYVTFILKFVRNKFTIDRINHFFIRSRFKSLESVVSHKVEFKNPQRISIGKGVVIRPYCWIAAMINDLPIKNAFDPWIEIHDGVSIGRFAHITVSKGLIIEKDVLITEGVLISDTIHGYEDINTPIIKQRMINRGPIRIKEGAWIGNGARIVGSVTIGKNSVVGANAYVDKDVPDYTVVGGIPAKILKVFNHEKKEWVKQPKQ